MIGEAWGAQAMRDPHRQWECELALAKSWGLMPGSSDSLALAQPRILQGGPCSCLRRVPPGMF